MKNLVLLFSILFSLTLKAQSVGVKVDDINAEEGTTIEIKKGVKSSTPGTVGTTPNGPLFQITEGEETIEGDGAPLLKQARSNWKKACAEWKKEFKEMNKENQILVWNCGKQNCATETMETVCSSKATYKLKVKVN